MREMYDLMDSVNKWIDDGQGIMNEYKEDMPSEEQENLKKRAEVLYMLNVNNNNNNNNNNNFINVS